MTPNRYSILKNVTYRLLRVLYTNTINIDRPYEDLDSFMFVSKYSYPATHLKLIAYSAAFFTVRVAIGKKRIFEEILAHFAAALGNVYCSRSVCSSRSL